MNEPGLEYIIEKYEHGWAVKTPPGRRGVPVEALQEASKLCANPKAVIDSGIANNINAIIVFGLPAELKKWREEIETWLKNSNLPKEMQWALGVDTGLSSLTIFATLCDQSNASIAYRRGFEPGEAPYDAGDFGRCYRLLQFFPEWEVRLNEVAEKYPKTAWSKIVPRWPELKALYEGKDLKNVTMLLRSLTK